MSDSQAVLHERRGAALWITINRTDKRRSVFTGPRHLPPSSVNYIGVAHLGDKTKL